MKTERRALHGEVRVPDDATRTFEAVVMNYGIADSYRTIFDAGCFKDSLETRLPRITWGHEWTDPIGRYVDYKDTAESLTLVGEFDDFDAVPRARQAYAQLKSGTIDQFSVGFSPETKAEDDDGIVHFKRATLDEAALVLVGAVPGTKLVSVRSAAAGGLTVVRQVPVDFVVDLGKKIAAGDLTHAEAEAALALAAGETPQVAPVVGTEDDTEVSEAEAEAAEALAELGL